MFGNFLFTTSSAVATCFDPPYVKLPTAMTSFPALMILPDNPKISFLDLGFGFEYTKFV